MQQHNDMDHPDLRLFLSEFATYDASLMVGEYLRKVLLHVYTSSTPHDLDVQAERQLALRLLARAPQLGHRFAWLFIAEVRGTALPTLHSSHVLRLSKRAQAATHDEVEALTRVLRNADSSFDMSSSPFTAMRYAHCLERALHEVVALDAAELNIVFRDWCDQFAETLRDVYMKYIYLLLSTSEHASQIQQDFVETMPFALDASRMEPLPCSDPAPL